LRGFMSLYSKNEKFVRVHLAMMIRAAENG
jgi:hypothetical protein